MTRFFPFLTWPRPQGSLLRADVLAGMTVGLMVLPQGVAYAGLAGMPLVTGIYAALLPALVAALWGSSTRLAVGPTALTSLLVFSALSPLAAPASPEWVHLAMWLAILSGLIQLLLGAGRLGWLMNLVTSPVLTGFTQGAILLILWSQVPTLLGWDRTGSGFQVQPVAATFGLVCVTTLLLMRRWRPRFPTAMAVVALSAGASYLLIQQGVAVGGTTGFAIVGTMPSGFPSLTLPALPAPQMWPPLLSSMVIALVSYLETASSAKHEHTRAGTQWNENQDLIAQGLAKLTSALCGAFPTSTSFSRAAVMLQSGAQSAWATVACSILIVVALLALMPVLYYVPRAVLSAVVIAAVLGLLKPRFLAQIWRVSRMEALTAATTFALTLATAPLLHWGVLAGILMGLSHFLFHRLHPRIIEVGLHPDGSLRDRHLWKLPPLAPHLYALRMDAELDFASSSGLANNIVARLSPDVRHVCLFAQPINRIDVTGVEGFQQLLQQLTARGVTLHISGIKLPVENALRRAQALPEGPLLQMYRTDAEALGALRQIRD
jgi:sulfate permease, SulP family